jgi:hypothetical protein
MRIMRTKFAFGACVAVALGAAIVAGCGGSGTSTALPGPGPNPSPSSGHSPGPSPSPSSNPSPSPSPSPLASPVLQVQGMQVATGGTVGGGFTYAPAPTADIAVFSCGCFPVAGTAQVQANGAFIAVSPATPTPSPGSSPYVMVAGRNYVVVAQPVSGAGPQAWTLLFEGKAPATTLGLGDTGSVLASSAFSDVYTAAAALYVYKKSTQCSPSGCNNAFDDWNFNTVQAWVTHLKAGPLNFAETTLLNDIAAQSASSASLFPAPKAPAWNPTQPLNAVIGNDINAVAGSNDTNLPTPCPGGPSACTGTPTP